MKKPRRVQGDLNLLSMQQAIVSDVQIFMSMMMPIKQNQVLVLIQVIKQIRVGHGQPLLEIKHDSLFGIFINLLLFTIYRVQK
jgi:hypothetical protein